MRALSLRPVDKEFRIESDAAARLGVELDHPAVDPVGVELRVDGAVKRIGEIDPPPVAAYFDHLWTAAEFAVLRARMVRARDNAADPHLAGELGIERIGYLLGSKYGRRLHFWDFTKRKHLQEIDFGEGHQLVFELRPAHDPTEPHGFVNCVISLKDLSSSIWTWYRDGDKWAVKKIISIPAEPAVPDLLPPVLKGFKAVPPLVTDIDLSMDDRFLYVACWGTGDLQQYDVISGTSPFSNVSGVPHSLVTMVSKPRCHHAS